MQFLAFNLTGPLQAWGTGSSWEVRDSGRVPTKSGVIGLLASALGYERSDPRIAQLHDMYRFHVSVRRAGLHFTDYQTITGDMCESGFNERARTALSERLLEQAWSLNPWKDFMAQKTTTKIVSKEYLADASFLAVLEPVSGEVDPVHVQALQNPRWPAYLGRRCAVPTEPVFAGVKESNSLLEWMSATRLRFWRTETPNGQYSAEGSYSGSGRLHKSVSFKEIKVPSAF